MFTTEPKFEKPQTKEKRERSDIYEEVKKEIMKELEEKEAIGPDGV